MSGYEIYRKALSLAGMTDTDGAVTDESAMLKRAMDALLHICGDLGIDAPESLSSEIIINDKQTNACVCGMAMLLSLGIGDTAANRMFGELYNAMRAEIKAGKTQRHDVLPCDDGGIY